MDCRSSLELIEKHVVELEKIYFPDEIIIPEPCIRPEDNIDPELIKMAKDKNLDGFYAIRRVPSDYYDKPFDYRRDCLSAQHIDQLTKCVLFENKSFTNERNRYICAVVQYVGKIDMTKLKSCAEKILKCKIDDLSLAPEEDATKLSGSIHNAMTPVFLRPHSGFEKYVVPIILSHKIAGLKQRFFWLGGGEVDVKFGITIHKFLTVFNPHVCDISQ